MFSHNSFNIIQLAEFKMCPQKGKNKMGVNFLCIYLGEGRRALMLVYIWEHT